MKLLAIAVRTVACSSILAYNVAAPAASVVPSPPAVLRARAGNCVACKTMSVDSAGGATSAEGRAERMEMADAGRDSSLLSPRAICDRYTDDVYAKMRDDEERTQAYFRAITKLAPNRLCLDIGTGSLALLAVMAARAGAAHVYALEANPDAAAAARRTVQEAGLAANITVIEGFSTEVSLPQRVELLLHEILGEVAGSEGVVAAVADAKRRHLLAHAQPPMSVPHRAQTLCAPCSFPEPEYFTSLPYPMLAAPGATVLKLPGLPRSVILAPAQPFEDLEFELAQPRPSQAVELEFVTEKAGELRGLALHIEVFLSSEDETPPVSSASAGSHWPNVLLLLPHPVLVRAGERLRVRASTELQPTPRYELEMFQLKTEARTCRVGGEGRASEREGEEEAEAGGEGTGGCVGEGGDCVAGKLVAEEADEAASKASVVNNAELWGDGLGKGACQRWCSLGSMHFP